MHPSRLWLPLVAVLLVGAGPAFGQATGGQGSKPRKVTREATVAVFAFKALNPEPRFQHFGEGASEAIINQIVREGALKIVEESQLDKAVNSLARNQTGLFEEDSALTIGQMVDARFIIVGSVDVMADQIAVSTRVLEVETRQLLVSERIHGPIANAFGLYDELAARITTRISSNLANRLSASTGDSADAVAVGEILAKAKRVDPGLNNGAGDLAAAVGLYKKAVLRDPNSAMARLGLGQALNQVGSYSEARYNLKQATELDKQNAWAWTELGVAEGKLGNPTDARAFFEKAVLLDPKYPKARFCLAVELYNAGQLPLAREQADAAARLGSEKAQGLLRDIDARIALSKQPKPAAR